VGEDRADLEPLGLHEAGHTFASLLIAAGADTWCQGARPRSPGCSTAISRGR